MKIIKCLLASLMLISSFITIAEETDTQTQAQTEEANLTPAYISDDLFVYMHAGPGNNYRIIGSINAGDEVRITNEVNNGYTQIIDDKNRTTWVESKYVSVTPGLRVAIAELNSKLASSEGNSQQASTDLIQVQNEMSQLDQQTSQLNAEITALKQQLTLTESKLTNQDLDLKKEYFFNGAIVLGLGLIFGLIIPRLSVRKKGSMENWK